MFSFLFTRSGIYSLNCSVPLFLFFFHSTVFLGHLSIYTSFHVYKVICRINSQKENFWGQKVYVFIILILPNWLLFLKIYIFNLCIWPCWVLVATREIFSCSMKTLSCGIWDLVPDRGLNPGPLHWEQGVLAPGPPGKSLRLTSMEIVPSYKPQVISESAQALIVAGFQDHWTTFPCLWLHRVHCGPPQEAASHPSLQATPIWLEGGLALLQHSLQHSAPGRSSPTPELLAGPRTQVTPLCFCPYCSHLLPCPPHPSRPGKFWLLL